MPPGLIVLVILFSPTALGEGARLEGVLTLTRALYEGPVDCVLSLDAANGSGTAGNPLRLGGSGTFLRLVVNWTYSDRAGVGTAPGDPDASLLSTALGPTKSGQRAYETGAWGIAATDASGTWLLTSEADASKAVIRSVAPTTLAPTTGDAWPGGSPAAVTSGGDEEDFFAVRHNVAAGRPSLETRGDVSIDATGTFTLYLWGIDLTVGDESYRSGVWTMGVADGAADSRGTARVDRAQLLRVTVEGSLVASTAGDTTRWSGPDAEHSSDARLTTQGTSGTLRTESAAEVYVDASLQLQGRTVTKVAAGDVPSRLRIEVMPSSAATVHSFSTSAAATVGRSEIRPPLATLLVLGTVVLVSAMVGGRWVYGRQRERLLGRVERALLDGRTQRGLRMLRPRLRSAPLDADAWFLQGAALLQAGAPDEVVRQLEPVARSLAPRGRAPLGFLLALAFARRGDAVSSWAWLQQAAIDPTFVRRARSEPEFLGLRGLPGFDRIMQDGQQAYA